MKKRSCANGVAKGKNVRVRIAIALIHALNLVDTQICPFVFVFEYCVFFKTPFVGIGTLRTTVVQTVIKEIATVRIATTF